MKKLLMLSAVLLGSTTLLMAQTGKKQKLSTSLSEKAATAPQKKVTEDEQVALKKADYANRNNTSFSKATATEAPKAAKKP